MNIALRVLLSLFSLMAGIGQIVVIMVYFFGLLRDNETEFVSDLLSSNDPLFVNVMTFFVLLQLTACFGFVRLHSPDSTSTRVAIESMFLTVSWVGWCVLILRYNNNNNTDGNNNNDRRGVSKLHFLGVGLFLSGGVVYFAFLMWELYSRNRNGYASAALMLLYISSVVLGGLFIIGYFSGWSCAWIFEHCAFMLFSAAHIFLFCIEAATSSSSSSSSSSISGGGGCYYDDYNYYYSPGGGKFTDITTTTTATASRLETDLFDGVRIQH